MAGGGPRTRPGSVTRAPTATVRLALDGTTVDVTMTVPEARALRARLRPFIGAARPVTADPPAGRVEPGLSERLRTARLRALLGPQGAGSSGRDLSVEPSPALADLLERTAQIYAQSLMPKTREAYRRRWAHFEGWCARVGARALPADAGTVMLYLASGLDDDPPASLGTLRGRVSAVNRVHVEHDLPAPGDDPALGLLMRGLARSVDRRPQPRPVSALRIEELREVCRSLEHPDPLVVRDAALLRLTVAGVDAAVLGRLRWQDVRWHDDGVELGVRSRKNAPVPDRWLTVPDGDITQLAPRPALERWLVIGGARPALVFTLVDRQGRRDVRGLGAGGITRILTTRMRCLGSSEATADATAAARLLDTTSADVLRDRALLLCGFAGAFRRGELTRLRWADVRDVDEGMVLRLRRSKTDPAGRGRDVGIPLGRSLLTCPVRALGAWRSRMQDQLGPACTAETGVFVRVGRAGRICHLEPLTEEGLTRVVQRRMAAAGLDGRWGGRSLRAGFISSAADLDLPLELIGQQSRHASLDSLIRYIRAEDPFRRNAADRVGL